MVHDCIFCKIIAGDIPCFSLFEDEETIAFMDINPLHPGHALVVPKAHAEDVFTISDDAIAAVVRTARRVAIAVRQALQPHGMNLLQCNGKAAAQSVLHFHIHVLPRQEGDGAPLNWSQKSGNMEEIGALAETIREHLQAS